MPQDDYLWLRVAVTTARGTTVPAGLIEKRVADDVFGVDVDLMRESAVLVPFVPSLAKTYLTTQPIA